jgi:predicted RNase H-like HicB family nuclease
VRFTIESEQETDGRWIAEVTGIPGALAYGTTREEAISRVHALAAAVVADRSEVGWEYEDGVFVVTVPELPGCMAHGDSEEEARANAQRAIRLWLDTEFEDPLPAPKSFDG